MQHSWPGNVNSALLCSQSLITVADLIFDNDGDQAQPNTAEILAAKFKANAASEVLS
jgi:hypothetical protein